jgi:pimeloyl-ACP methyl ester carboxylesterase
MVMVESTYGMVLHPDWAQQLVRDHHPRDGSRVYTAGPRATAGRVRKGGGSVVLLHGIGNSGAIWGPVLPAIAELAEAHRLGPVVAPTLSRRSSPATRTIGPTLSRSWSSS